MKAMVRVRYGSADVLELRDVDKPAVGDDQVLIRVRAAAVNPYDWHFLTGIPYIARLSAGLRRPKDPALGLDLAGRVEAVGRAVTEFRPGDDVFGMRSGAFAEYVAAPERGLVGMPTNLTYAQAAAVPLAGVTALQALRRGRLGAGQQVLINGAAGGVGTFAVQLAVALGAEVTGVCSSRNVDLVGSLGAARVVDYTRVDFTRTDQRYHLIVDNAGSRPLTACRRLLRPHGTLVLVSGPKTGRVLGPATRSLRAIPLSLLGRTKLTTLLAKPSKADLLSLRDQLAAGEITPVIDRSYPLADLPAALTYVGGGHAPGKVVISV